MSKARVVGVTSGAAAALGRGHPWVWRAGVARAADGLATGDVVELKGATGEPLGQGIWDATSPIAARVYTRDAATKLDAAFIVAAVGRAIERRSDLVARGDTTAYRLCHGEGDRVPGVVIDRYDAVAILRLDGAAIASWLPRLAAPLGELLERAGVRSFAHRTSEKGAHAKLERLSGTPPPENLEVRENGVAMIVDLTHGQKTGAFLDQRDNRARVRELAKGRRVLNLFSYAGGFSTSAVLGGGTHVTSVDVAHAAHRDAERSMRANGIDPARHAFVTADAFAFLEAARAKGQLWDLIVSDPPSFAPSEKAKPRALSAYRKLHGAAAAVLAPGGVLCAASCSSHVTAEDFATTLDDAALGRTDLSLAGMFGPPADHPTVAAFSEGRYLKFAVLR
jgi:23S rRNA (cytosine1962-C5)-methyltransferase